MRGADRPPPGRADTPRARSEIVALAAAASLHAAVMLLRFVAPEGARVGGDGPAEPIDAVEIDIGIADQAPHPALGIEPGDVADDARADAVRPRATPTAPSIAPFAETIAPPPASRAKDSRAAAIDEPDDGAIARATPAHREPRGDPASPPASEPSGERPSEPPSGPPAAPPGDEYGGPPGAVPGVVGVLPGLGSRPAWAMPGVLPDAPARPSAAPTAPPAPRDVDRGVATQVLEGTLRKRDRELGLDAPAGGVVATALGDAVRASEAPSEARATFEVRLGPGGEVLGVRVVSASAGDAGTWERVAQRAKAALGARRLDMGPGGKAATVTVKIESSLRYPAGSKDEIDMRPVCANEVIEELEAFLNDPSAAGAGRATVQGGAATGKPGVAAEALRGGADDEKRTTPWCIPLGVRARGDLSNIGAKAHRVVRTSFQVAREGERNLPSDAARPLDDRAPWLAPTPGKAQRLPPPKRKKKKKR